MCVCVCDHIFNPTLSQVIISVSFSWLICYILTASNVFSEDEKDITYNARTDTKLQVLYDAAWFRIPYPGKTSYMKWCHGKTIRAKLNWKESETAAWRPSHWDCKNLVENIQINDNFTLTCMNTKGYLEDHRL